VELNGISRARGPSQPAGVARRAEAVIPAGSAPEPTVVPAAGGGAQQAAVEPAPRAPAAPPFEWLDLEIIPLGQKPDPRGYAIYSQRPRPRPAPVILIETA